MYCVVDLTVVNVYIHVFCCRFGPRESSPWSQWEEWSLTETPRTTLRRWNKSRFPQFTWSQESRPARTKCYRYITLCVYYLLLMSAQYFIWHIDGWFLLIKSKVMVQGQVFTSKQFSSLISHFWLKKLINFSLASHLFWNFTNLMIPCIDVTYSVLHNIDTLTPSFSADCFSF